MTLIRFFTRNFAGLGQRAGVDAGKEWVSGSCKPYIAKSQSGIERIRLLEMLNRVFVVGAVSLTPIKQNKTLAKFFSAPF